MSPMRKILAFVLLALLAGCSLPTAPAPNIEWWTRPDSTNTVVR